MDLRKANESTGDSKKSRFNITRRAFIKLTALTGAATAVALRLAHRPALADALIERPPEGAITEKYVATSCLNCATRCATRVRVVNGRAVKIAGNPISQVSEGENCPRAHIGLQVLYDPDRLKSPMKRTNSAKGKGIDPRWTPISWGQALEDITAHLIDLRAGGNPHKLALFQGLNTISDEDVIRRFAESYGTPNLISAEGLENEADKAGEWMADGNFTQSAYDLARTNYILAFGANIVESQKPLARNLRMWGKMRRERPNRVKVVVVDPRYSVTAAKSDQWLPINPGTDAALAMAIAWVIIAEKLYDTSFVEKYTTGFDAYRKLVVENYRPEKVASITGISAETIEKIAREFAATKPAIAWRGRGATGWPNGAYTSYAIFCLNALVGSIDAPGGVTYQLNPDYKALPAVTEDDTAKKGKSQPRIDLGHTADFPAAETVTNQAADSIIESKPYNIEMAFGFNCNFNMSAPATARWGEALKKLPYYVHIAPSVSEMAEYADIVLPSPTFLEEWGYDHSPPGSGFAEVKLKQPAVEKLYDSMSIIDVLFELAGRLGGSVTQSFMGLGKNAQEFVQFRTGNLLGWSKLLSDGVWVDTSYKFNKYDSIFKTPSKKFEFRSGNLEARFKELGKTGNEQAYLPHYEPAEFFGDEKQYPLVLTTYHPVLKIDSDIQNYPWAQEIYLAMHARGWGNFVEINEETAHELHIDDLDEVWVESPFGKLKAKARVFTGVHPHVVSIAMGQGHTAGGRWAEGMGINPNDITGVAYDHTSGQSAFYNTRVRVYRA
ncbi:MAG: molybdopterin-dependent oxidoreductase [Dehalococcoidales bacterium]|nr:molybdopterin-dependent oxidoreductase [Dehalococcoidales bacterium]